MVELRHAPGPMSQRRQRYNLVFLASCEEEVSGKEASRRFCRCCPKIDVAGGRAHECTPLWLKGGGTRQIAFKSGMHARRGENAIYKALPMIERLRSLSFPLTSAHLGYEISVTQISRWNATQRGTRHMPYSGRRALPMPTPVGTTQSDTAGCAFILTPRSVALRPSGISEQHPIVRRLVIAGRKRHRVTCLASDRAVRQQEIRSRASSATRGRRIHTYGKSADYPNLAHHSTGWLISTMPRTDNFIIPKCHK